MLVMIKNMNLGDNFILFCFYGGLYAKVVSLYEVHYHIHFKCWYEADESLYYMK